MQGNKTTTVFFVRRCSLCHTRGAHGDFSGFFVRRLFYCLKVGHSAINDFRVRVFIVRCCLTGTHRGGGSIINRA